MNFCMNRCQGTLTCISRRTWAFRLCSRPCSNGIFGRGWTKTVYWFVNFWCFVIIWLPIVRSKLVHCHRGVSWVCHEFGRCSAFARLISICWKFVWDKNPSFLWRLQKALLEVRVGWSHVQTGRPSRCESGWHLTDFVMIQCEEIPDFYIYIISISVESFCSENFTNFNEVCRSAYVARLPFANVGTRWNLSGDKTLTGRSVLENAASRNVIDTWIVLWQQTLLYTLMFISTCIFPKMLRNTFLVHVFFLNVSFLYVFLCFAHRCNISHFRPFSEARNFSTKKTSSTCLVGGGAIWNHGTLILLLFKVGELWTFFLLMRKNAEVRVSEQSQLPLWGDEDAKHLDVKMMADWADCDPQPYRCQVVSSWSRAAAAMGAAIACCLDTDSYSSTSTRVGHEERVTEPPRWDQPGFEKLWCFRYELYCE